MAQAQENGIGPSEYERAEEWLWHYRDSLVPGTHLKLAWVDDGHFWVRMPRAQGHEYVLVDAASGEQRPAFDHEQAAHALGEAADGRVTPWELDVETIRPDGTTVIIVDGVRWTCDAGYQCAAPRRIQRKQWELPSPDGQWLAFVRGYNLWVRSADGDEERALTRDGTATCPYAMATDPGQRRPLLALLGASPAPAAIWSPDSRHLLTQHLDQSDVRIAVLTESTPLGQGAPVYHKYRYPLAGDEHMPTGRFISIDIATGTQTAADTAPVLVPHLLASQRGEASWLDSRKALYYTRDRWHRMLTLEEFDTETGTVRTVIEETMPQRVDTNPWSAEKPITTVLPDRGLILWWSQRDGWGHLYRYDLATGALQSSLTKGDFLVTAVLHVDEAGRTALLSVTGLAEDPYLHQLARLDIDSGAFTVIVSDEDDHEFTVSPTGRFVVDRASRVDHAPVTSVLDLETSERREVHRCDDSAIRAAGWTPPVRVRLTGADGVTPIWGTLVPPHRLNEGLSYPLVDDLYPGPQVGRSTPSWFPLFPTEDVDSLAALGIAVLLLDGRGTPGRDLTFQTPSFGNRAGAGGLVDHVAALPQLAERFPWIDTTRVAARGRSGGGFATVRAMIDYPKVYKFGVATSGSHDERYYQGFWMHGYQGPPEESDWSSVSNPDRVERLEGPVLLTHGEMDDNVHSALSLRLFTAMLAAGKEADLRIVPGTDHDFAGQLGYEMQLEWDFLIQHLLGARPPRYRVKDLPVGLRLPDYLRC